MKSDNQRVIVHGIPGEGARGKGVCKAIIPLLFCVFLFGIFSGVILPVDAGAPVMFGFAGIFILVLWLAYDFYNGVSSYFKGARGEEIVAVWLAGGLPGGYHVFHDLDMSGSAPIDHLVVGPTGIFVIETKYWSGQVTCDGDSLVVDGMDPTRSPVDQANVEVKALHALLSAKMSNLAAITPIVCFAGNTLESRVEGGALTLNGVGICNVDSLCDFILSGDDELSPVEIERFVKLMEYQI